MVQGEPLTPEPATDRSTFSSYIPADHCRLLARRGLARHIEIDNTKDAGLGIQIAVDAIKHRVKRWDLQDTSNGAEQILGGQKVWSQELTVIAKLTIEML